MTEARRNSLSLLMRLAWSFRREEPLRAFADCLRGAWKLTKKLAKSTARRPVAARDLTSSPIKRALRGTRCSGYRAYGAAYHTAIFGH